MRLDLKRLNDAYHLRATNAAGATADIDNSPDEGGQNLGVRPMEMVAMGLAGCSSMDVLSILQKGRQVVTDYGVAVEAERDYDQTPAVFKSIRLHFHLEGEVEPEKAQRAIELSLGKYCSVSRMLEKTATITFAYTVNGQTYAPGITYGPATVAAAEATEENA